MLPKAPSPSSFSRLLRLETASMATGKALVRCYQDCLGMHAKAAAHCHPPLSKHLRMATKAVLVHDLHRCQSPSRPPPPTFVKALLTKATLTVVANTDSGCRDYPRGGCCRLQYYCIGTEAWQ